MIFIYLLILLGLGITSLGIPSKTGRKGSASASLLAIGLALSLGGAVFILIQGMVVESLIVVAATFLVPGMLAYLRK